MLLTMLWLTCATASAAPISVSDAWHSAMEHDPKFAAAQAQRDAGRARGAEGRALWLPTLSATGGVGLSDLDNRTQGAFFSAPGFGSRNGVDFQTNVNGATATHWALVAEQPLFDAGRLADSTAQKDSARIAEAQYRAAEQDLMLRSTRVYFDVLNARAQLQTLVRLRASAQTTRAEAQARYEAGDIPVTDMREAEADADNLTVQELDARSAVTLSEAAFSDLTGLEAIDLGVVPEAATAELPAPDPLASWTRRAIANSPLLAIQQLTVASATAQVNRYNALTSPRVNLIAQVGRDSLHGNGDFGATDITQRDASVGIQASVPLFTGGLRSAQRHEARALEHQAEAELDGTEQAVRQQTRTAWLSLTTAAARVQALQHLRASTESRRDATRLGAQIGARTALELLNAEADYQRSGADFQRAQSEWLLARLQLKAVAGELAAEDLEQIDRRLASDMPQSK
jgi:outer membrane protein